MHTAAKYVNYCPFSIVAAWTLCNGMTCKNNHISNIYTDTCKTCLFITVCITVYRTLVSMSCDFSGNFPLKQSVIMIVQFLLRSVLYEHVSLCLEDLIWRLKHLCSTTEIHFQWYAVTHSNCSWFIELFRLSSTH